LGTIIDITMVIGDIAMDIIVNDPQWWYLLEGTTTTRPQDRTGDIIDAYSSSEDQSVT
jgi:hypothetical protein